MKEKAIAFWQEVNSRWHNEDITKWIELLAQDNAEWFRNGGLALETISIHSTNKRGGYSHHKYEENRKALNEIYAKYNLCLQG